MLQSFRKWINEAIIEIGKDDFKKGHLALKYARLIKKETDKAIMIEYPENVGYDGSDIIYKDTNMWLPKASVSIKDNYVIGISRAMAKNKNVATTSRGKSIQTADLELKNEKNRKPATVSNYKLMNLNKYGLTAPEAFKETDKALGYVLGLDFYDVEKDLDVMIYIPKSILVNDRIPVSFLKRKIQELRDKYSSFGGFGIDDHPFTDIEFENITGEIYPSKTYKMFVKTNSNTMTTAEKNKKIAELLNVKDVSRWNQKIYKYGNGERCVYINNDKIVLTDEQFNQLNELID